MLSRYAVDKLLAQHSWTWSYARKFSENRWNRIKLKVNKLYCNSNFLKKSYVQNTHGVLKILDVLGKITFKNEEVLFEFCTMCSEILVKTIKLVLSKFQTCLDLKIIVELFSCEESIFESQVLHYVFRNTSKNY